MDVVVLHGKAGLFGYSPLFYMVQVQISSYTLVMETYPQPPSITRILGSKHIIELSCHDHKRVRATLVSFLKLEVLKQYVGKVDEEIQYLLQTHWHRKHEVQPLIKTLTFNVICSLLFGIERRPERKKLLPLFQDMIEGVLAIPINLPYTRFNRGILARKKLVPMLIHLIRIHKDLITLLLSIHDDDSSMMMSEEKIIDKIIVVMVAGYDTTSILLTFLIRLLANNKSVYSSIVREQEEIAKSKASGEALTWEDLTKMKYTWRVANEMMQINPPMILSFQRAKQDIEYGNFIIPKGWQVLLSQSMTHMDDSIFQNPSMFDPTRFEKDAPSPPPFSYVAFGGGPRMCPGMELAKMETLASIYRLMTQFSRELLKKEDSFKRIQMIESGEGVVVRIKPIK